MKKFLLGAALAVAALCGGGFGAQAQNAYAYGVKAGELSADGSQITLYYSLNTAATAVTVDVYAADKLFKTFTSDKLAAGPDTLTISTDGLPKGQALTWKVNVTGAKVETAVAAGPVYNFWSPYGIAVNNNPYTDNFGEVLVTESQPNVPAAGYHTSAEGQGIYAFTPALEPIKNASDGLCFKGGLTFTTGKYGNASSTIFGPKRIHFSAEGRLFMSTGDPNLNHLYEVDPTDLNKTFTPIFTGTYRDTANYGCNLMTADSAFIAGANASFDVKGVSDNLKIVALSCDQGQGFSYGIYTTNEYNLGTATSWDKAPSANIDALTHQYTISSQSVNIVYDNKGGIWYVQYRGTPTEAQPAIKHINAAGVEDYSDITTVARSGGVAFNPDFSKIAIATGKKQISVFAISTDSVGKPVLTKLYSIATAFNGSNDIAWDVADNLYTCDNSSERFGMYQLPRDTDVVTTPAMAKYAFTIPAPQVLPTLTLASKNTTVPAVADNREGVFIDNNWFIMDKKNKVVQVYDTEGNPLTTTFAAGACTNIGKDEAGNLIVRMASDFPSSPTTSIRIIPTDGSAPVDVAISGVTEARNDWYGTAQGNLLSPQGGRLYILPNNSTKLSVVTIKNGVQDVAASHTFDVAGASGYSIVYSFTPGVKEHVMVCPRGTDKSYLDGTLAADGQSMTTTPLFMPGKTESIGATFFTMGGVNYVVYPSGTKYMDGFSIAPVSSSEATEAAVTHEPTVTSAPNTFTANWFGVKVLSDTVANIFQYYPGGFFAMYKFTMPRLMDETPTAYVMGEITANADKWAANVGAPMTHGEGGVFKAVVSTDKTDAYYGLTMALGTSADDWATVSKNRLIPDVDGTVLPDGVATHLSFGTDKAWKFDKQGTYQLILNIGLDSMTITANLWKAAAVVTYPEKLYVIGNLGSPKGDWKPNDDTNILTKSATTEGEYTGQITVFNQVDANSNILYAGWFALGSQLGTTDTDWDTFNAHRLGPKEDNTILESGVAGPLFATTNASYKVEIPAVSNTYNVVANLKDNTILLTLVSTGVDKVSTNDVRVVAGTGEINIFGNAQNVSVYTAGGALISKNQVRVNCAPGMYVVRANGKTFKVFVK
jgi:hypothetical protein